MLLQEEEEEEEDEEHGKNVENTFEILRMSYIADQQILVIFHTFFTMISLKV